MTRPKRRWEIRVTGDYDNLYDLLAEGWEPFAVFLNVGYVHVLRRRRWRWR